MPSAETLELIEVFSNPDPEALTKYFQSLGWNIGTDDPVDPTTIPEEDWMDGMKVTPTPAITRYLATGDELETATVHAMEDCIEKHYGVKAPWYIAAHAYQISGEPIKLDYFYLGRED